MAITLHAVSRDARGKKVRQLRRRGMIPAVLFGKQLPSRDVAVPALEFSRLRHRIGPTTLLDIEVDSAPAVQALLHHVQTHPRTSEMLHLELYQVNLEDKIKVTVPIHVDGDAPAVTLHGGTLIVAHDRVEIKCDAGHLVSSFHADVSRILSFEDHIKVKDLEVPEGVEMLTDPETILVGVAAPRVEVEEIQPAETVEATEGAAPEIESPA